MGVEKIRRRLRVKGALTVEGASTFGSAMTGVRGDAEIQTGDDTLLAAESGKIIKATKSSATQTFTLPAATEKGVVFTFICGHADGEIKIDPAGTDNIRCKATNDSGASIAPASGTGIVNTTATNVLGDYITLIADGVDQWDCIAQSGIWASQ